jgi:hypothetical protein
LPASARRQDYIDHVLRHGRHTYGAHVPGQSRRTIEITNSWNLPDPFLPNESLEQYHNRTGCPPDLVSLALDRLPSAPLPLPSLHNQMANTIPTVPLRRYGQRRIIPSS